MQLKIINCLAGCLNPLVFLISYLILFFYSKRPAFMDIPLDSILNFFFQIQRSTSKHLLSSLIHSDSNPIMIIILILA